MVKLSYAGRKIQGLKLGQIVAKDLRKRIPPGSGARVAARDPTAELDLTGKLLTDEGLAEIVDALVECIQFQNETFPQGVVKLTELIVKGNALTVAGMAKLAPVVALSNSSLVKLDISDNEIEITNKTQRCDWCTFLMSFEGCFMLKTVDFSGNKLGSQGFDVISKVYLKSDLDYVEPSPIGNHHDNGDVQGVEAKLKSIDLNSDKNNSTGSIAGTEQAIRAEGGVKPSEQGNEQLYASTRGLRSVPYLIFTKSGNTTACAFHLWCMLMIHVGSEKLLEYLPAGKSMAPPEGLQTGAGLVYSLDEFKPLGRNLLNLGVQFLSEFSKVNDDIDLLGSGEELDRGEVIKARETCRRTQIEMERVKYRAVLDTLTVEDVRVVELWDVAFKTMVVARALLLDDEDRPRSVAPPSYEIDQSSELNKMSDQALEMFYSQPESPWDNFTEEFPSLPESPDKRKAGGTANPGNPQATCKKRRANSGLRELMARNSPRAELIKMSPQAMTRPAPKTVFKETGPFGLPIRLWVRIIVEAMDENGVLSPQQQMRIVRYACDWDSIKQELKIKGGTEPEQIRKILNSMDCLVYSKFE